MESIPEIDLEKGKKQVFENENVQNDVIDVNMDENGLHTSIHDDEILSEEENESKIDENE